MVDGRIFGNPVLQWSVQRDIAAYHYPTQISTTRRAATSALTDVLEATGVGRGGWQSAIILGRASSNTLASQTEKMPRCVGSYFNDSHNMQTLSPQLAFPEPK